MATLLRRPGPLLVLGTSALGGAAYRYANSSSASDATLNPHTFTPYTLVEKTPVSSTSAIFTLRNSAGAPSPASVLEGWKKSTWSVQIKQPQLQIARAYTPLPRVRATLSDAQTDDELDQPEDIRLLIRQEKGGEVSTYLHRLPLDSEMELRGPNTEYELPDDIRDVIFLAGGTGIAPAMQVAQAVARRPGTRMSILWANRRREECVGGVSDEEDVAESQGLSGWWRSWTSSQRAHPHSALEVTDTQPKGAIVRELEALKSHFSTSPAPASASVSASSSVSPSDGLRIQYYVDEEKTFIRPADVAKRLGKHEPEERGSRLIVVSGPEGFMEYWAGKKVWIGGREVQGPLGGALKGIGIGGWEVVKM